MLRLTLSGTSRASRGAASRRAFTPTVAAFAKKSDLVFLCGECGYESPVWSGKCRCGAWNSFKEYRPPAGGSGAPAASARNTTVRSWLAAPGAGGGGAAGGGAGKPAPMAAETVAKALAGKKTASSKATASSGTATAAGEAPPAAADEAGFNALAGLAPRLTRLGDVPLGAFGKNRLKLGSPELDRVFGGGIVPASCTLITGTPGVGKSTLLLQMAGMLAGATSRDGAPYASTFVGAAEGGGEGGAASTTTSSVLQPSLVAYVSGEESAAQIRARADRLGLDAPTLLVMNETRLEDICAQLDEACAAAKAVAAAEAAEASGSSSPSSSSRRPPFSCVIIDSIQTIFTDSLPTAAAGTVTQVRECAVRLTQWAKASGCPVFLVGHVTKAGDLAGPRVLEHLVDTVVMIEGEESLASGAGGGGSSGGVASASSGGGGWGPASSPGQLRVVRCIKNRFGSTSEVGLLEMGEAGFQETDPARLLLTPSSANGRGEDGEEGDDAVAVPSGTGAAVAVTLEGSRPLCVELQALATPTLYPYPRHRATGVSLDRVSLLLAVLSRHTPVRGAAFNDVLVNVVGGLRLADPTTDLALLVSLASSLLGLRPAPRRSVFIGEVGLGGEVRPAFRLQQRLAAAAKLGFTTAYVPAATTSSATAASAGSGSGGASSSSGEAGRRLPTIVPVSSVKQVLNLCFPGALTGLRSGGKSGGSRWGSGGGGGYSRGPRGPAAVAASSPGAEDGEDGDAFAPNAFGQPHHQ